MLKRSVISLVLTLCGSCALFHPAVKEPAAHPELARVEVRMESLGLSPEAKGNLALVGEALKQLEDHAARGENLGAEDQSWLTRLTAGVGRDTLLAPDPQEPTHQKSYDCRITVEELNASLPERQTLANSLRVVMAASLERPTRVKLGALEIPVHNHAIGALLRPSYSAQNFKELLAFLEKNGVFNEQVDEESGLVKTSGIAEGENSAMLRQWVTDTVRCGDLQRHVHPLSWPKALMTLAHFYAEPVEAKVFHEIIQDPSRYTKGDVKVGVAHIFDPKKLTRDAGWFNNKRLESHGLALKAFCDTLVDGFVFGRPWGFNVALLNQPEQLKTLSEAIASLSGYMIAIHYYDAPSAGPWEETPFAGGLTWDIEAVRAGLESCTDLMENPAYRHNPSMVKMRAALQKTTYARFLKQPALSQAITQGRRKVLERLVRAKVPAEHPLRPLDASTVFIAGSSLQMAHDLTKDVRRHLKVLDYVQQGLVRENGMLRYAPFKVVLRDGSAQLSPDSYLTKNYWIAFDRDNKLNLPWRHLMDAFGSKDASDLDVFVARARFATPHSEAEWFMVSDVAYGYAYQASRILDLLQRSKRDGSPAENELVREAMAKATEFVNRSLARLTDSCEGGYPCVKSNGHEVPPFSVPEAYEFVSTLDPAVASGALAGAHTPHAWARASLYRALMQYHANLQRITPKSLGPKVGSSYAHLQKN